MESGGERLMARKKKKVYDPTVDWTPEQWDHVMENAGTWSQAFHDGRPMALGGSGGGSGSSGSSGSNVYVRQGADPGDPNSIQIEGQRTVNGSWPAWAKPTPDAGPGDPDLAKPYPTGRSVESLKAIGTPTASNELVARQQAVKAYTDDPKAWAEAHTIELNADQTVLDKGLDFVSRLFNYEDESDLTVFGMNLSAVESTWDMAARYMTGGRNALDAGITAAISAMPGGVQTYEWGQITDNHNFGEVLHGDIGLTPNVGPSPMQTAIASVGIETKRIREGGGRLSDALLMNPVTAPFIMAGLLAESSPLQQDGFDLLDPEQRAKAFGSGYEQFFSGVGDFGVQMASPWIGISAGMKAASLGMLGTKFAGQRGAQLIASATADAGDKVMKANHEFRVAKAAENGEVIPEGPAPTMTSRMADHLAGATARRARQALLKRQTTPLAQQLNVPAMADEAEEFFKDISDRGLTSGRDAAKAKEAYLKGRANDDAVPDVDKANLPIDVQDEIKFSRETDTMFDNWQKTRIQEAAKTAGIDVPAWWDQPKVTRSADELGLTNPLERLINDIAQVDESGNKVMSQGLLESRKEFRRNPMRAEIASILHSMDDPFMISHTLAMFHGAKDSERLLSTMAPAISDAVYRIRSQQVVSRGLLEPTKQAEMKHSFELAKAQLAQQRDLLLKEEKRVRPGESIVTTDVDVDMRISNIEDSIAEMDAILSHFDDTKPIDLLAPGPFYKSEQAARVLRDLEIRQDAQWMATSQEIKKIMLVMDQDSRLILNDNWYARMVNGSRERSARARYEYLQEGGGLGKRMVIDEINTADLTGPARGRFVGSIERGFLHKEFYADGIGHAGRRLMRVWRYLGTETPAGYVGLKGAARSDSTNEIRAVLDLDIYYGKPVKVIYNDELKGNRIERMVGGVERRAELQKRWDDALANPYSDMKSVAVSIENDIMTDIARAHGIPLADMKSQMRIGDKLRAASLDSVQKHGMVVDPSSGAMDHVPYLKHQLANGHYMHNWHAIERMVQKVALDTMGPRAGSATRKFANGVAVGGEYMGKLNTGFQSIWRPAVLFRMSYITRNNFEGMVRAAAYYGSAAPLLWPVQAIGNGVVTVARRSAVKAATKNFVRKVNENPVYAEKQAAIVAANTELFTLQTAPLWLPSKREWEAMKANGELGARWMDSDVPETPLRYVYERSEKGPIIKDVISDAEWQKRLQKSFDKAESVKLEMDGAKAALDSVAKGRFAKWRDKNIEDLEKMLEGSCKTRAGVTEAMNVATAAGAAPSLAQAIDTFADNAMQEVLLQHRLDTLKYDAAGAVAMYRQSAGRAKRIGSGTSIGPDGGTWSDAFSDAFEVMNRDYVSSDTARKMALSAGSDAYTNIFMNMLVERNAVVRYSIKSHDDWVRGMAQTIESNAWNPLVAIILNSNLDPDDAVKWMMKTEEGQEFLRFQRQLEGSDFAGDGTMKTPASVANDPDEARAFSTYSTTAYEKASKLDMDIDPNDPPPLGVEPRVVQLGTRLRTTGSTGRNPVTAHLDTFDDLEAATTYANHVAMTLRFQLQDMPEFIELARRRANAVKNGEPTMIRDIDVDDIVRGLPPERIAMLGAVRGDIGIKAGTRTFKETYRWLVDKAFTVIGTIPEDAIVRGPFYNKRFKQVRNQLIVNWYEQNMGSLPAGVKRGLVTKGGKNIEDGITHTPLQMRVDDMNEIIMTAHKQALYDTREHLYTIERRTNLGKHGEAISPFISASQNTLTAGGKIIYRNPWVVPLGMKMWSLPLHSGFVDEEGNMRLTMPYEWVKHMFESASGIPVVGGLLSGKDYITVPMNQFNVFSPDSGFFGVVPRPTPLIQWTTSELMRNSILLTPGTPDVMANIVGKENADTMWGLFKDYIFGEEGAISTRTASWDILFPPTLRYIIDSKDELSDAYAFHYDQESRQQWSLYNAGEREKPPTSEEIGAATTNKFLFYAWTSFGLPSPLPTFGRLEVQKPIATEAQKLLQNYMQAQGMLNPDGSFKIEPGMATQQFEQQFGPEILKAAYSGTTESTGGAEPTDATIADIQALDPFIRDLTKSMNGQYEMLDMIVNNNSDPEEAFSNDAFRWQKSTEISGASEAWRSNLTGEELEKQREMNAGWTEYQVFKEKLDSEMYALGIKNMQVAAAEPLRQRKRIWEENMARSNPIWFTDWKDGAPQRTSQAISMLEKAVSDDRFVSRMFETGNEGLVSAMKEYVYYRRNAVIAQQESGLSWSDPENLSLRVGWENIRTDLALSNVRWAEIQNRWLGSDEDPTFVGGDLGVSTESLGEGITSG